MSLAPRGLKPAAQGRRGLKPAGQGAPRGQAAGTLNVDQPLDPYQVSMTGQSETPSPIVPRPRDGMGNTDVSELAEIEQEVNEALAEMDPTDRAELCGEVPVAAREGHGPEEAHPGIRRAEAAGIGAGDVSDQIKSGTEVTGTIAAVSDDDVFLEFGAKTQGVLPRSQFGKKETLNVGRRVDVIVDRYDAGAGLLVVSRKGAALKATWTNLRVGMLVTGKVKGVIKGGLEVDLNGIRGFMPASQTDVAPMKDISILLNETVKCEVIEVERRSKNVLLSRRKVIEQERAEAREKLRAELAVGQSRKGVVRNITEYGAFIDLGGVDGLAHVRDLSWGSVEKVSDVLTIGQEVEVRVLKIDAERQRISLGIKQCQANPWEHVGERYPVNAAVKARVIRLADFGAFAELEPGVEALIPVSELGWQRFIRVSEAVKVGDVVDAVVIRVEPGKCRIALSIKQAQPDPWALVFDSFEEQSLVTGKVKRLADFGVFVELVPGVEGLIHISELADHRVKSCSEVVKVGDEVETRVLGIDRENRRIALSIKAVNARPAPAATESEGRRVEPDRRKPKKQRKKPLRGGLASHFDW